MFCKRYAMSRRKRQSGLAILDALMWVAIIVTMSLGSLAIARIAWDNVTASKTVEMAKQIAQGAISWRAGRFNYNGISLADLESRGFLPPGFAARGTPVGGAWGLTGSGNSITITASGFNSDTHCQNAWDKISADVSTGGCASSQLTMTFQ